MLKKIGNGEGLTIPTGKDMRRSMSVTFARVTQKAGGGRGGGWQTARESTSGGGGQQQEQEEKQVPDELLDMLLLLQVDSLMNIPSAMSVANPPEVAAAAEALLCVYAQEGSLHMPRLLDWCLRRLISSEATPETLFRGTSLEMRIVSSYLHVQCRPFLSSILLPLVQWLSQLDVALEVDPQRLASSSSATTPSSPPRVLPRNRKLLLDAANRLLSALSLHANLLPAKLCSFLRQIRSAVEGRFPAMADRSVGALLFLRVINPALVAPDKFLQDDKDKEDRPVAELSSGVRRSLVLVSKLLQNLANGVSFGEKEDFLEFANPWLALSAPTLSSFIFDTIYAIRKPLHDSLVVSPSLSELISSVRWLHNFFCARKKSLVEKVFPVMFKGAEGKKNGATFLAQLRRATNDFRPVAQNDMPQEWI